MLAANETSTGREHPSWFQLVPTGPRRPPRSPVVTCGPQPPRRPPQSPLGSRLAHPQICSRQIRSRRNQSKRGSGTAVEVLGASKLGIGGLAAWALASPASSLGKYLMVSAHRSFWAGQML